MKPVEVQRDSIRYPPLRGIFAGNNDLVEGIGGKKPTPLQDFITNHLPEFTS
ncbi:MAG: hypothetical protein QOI33_2905 [Mycobacterium sp.]|nr:hypothetical protein [Mycobacterium sp.]